VRSVARPLLADPSWTVDGGVAWFGRSVANAGDVDGDRFDDIVIGAYLAFNHGRAYLYRGGVAGRRVPVVRDRREPRRLDRRRRNRLRRR